MEERRENIMGTQPINRLLPSMAFPIMLSMLVQALYNVVDSVFVSMVKKTLKPPIKWRKTASSSPC